MSQSSSPTSTVTSQAPSWQLPYLTYGLNQALAQYQNVTNPQQLVAPFSTQQNQAITGITNLATDGTPETSAAQQYVTNVLQGTPANNPYLDAEFNLGANAVQNRVESEFGRSGANVINSLPVQTDELNNLATQLYGGAYNTGIQQQENALGQAVPLEQEQLGMQNALYGAGANVQGQAQNYINAPQQFLANYLNQVSGGNATTKTTSVPSGGALGALGGALTGGQLGSAIAGSLGAKSGGTGQTIGGLLGSLLGAYLGG